MSKVDDFVDKKKKDYDNKYTNIKGTAVDRLVKKSFNDYYDYKNQKATLTDEEKKAIKKQSYKDLRFFIWGSIIGIILIIIYNLIIK